VAKKAAAPDKDSGAAADLFARMASSGKQGAAVRRSYPYRLQ
jgi:hypothetical protein